LSHRIGNPKDFEKNLADNEKSGNSFDTTQSDLSIPLEETNEWVAH
jgi:hypothetical protein